MLKFSLSLSLFFIFFLKNGNGTNGQMNDRWQEVAQSNLRYRSISMTLLNRSALVNRFLFLVFVFAYLNKTIKNYCVTIIYFSKLAIAEFAHALLVIPKVS